MDMELLTSLGLGANAIAAITICVLVVPLFWKLWKEALSLRHGLRKDKLDSLFQVLDHNGISTHPLRVELVFQELFGYRLTFAEIRYFLGEKSPLGAITNYKHARRYLQFDDRDASLVLTVKTAFLKLRWVSATVGFILSGLLLMLSFLYILVAVKADQSALPLVPGVMLTMTAVAVAYVCLDLVRAVFAAKRLLEAYASKEKAKSLVYGYSSKHLPTNNTSECSG